MIASSVSLININMLVRIFTVARVPQCLSSSLNWDPHPLSRKRVCPYPRNQRVGGHSPAGEGRVGPNSDDWRKSLALCLL
jgi:hypothetical protein